MINLVRNELKKIFHKKAIYIILAIAIGFMILNIVLTKYFESSNNYYDSESDIKLYSGILNELDKNSPTYKEEYNNFKTQLEIAKLLQNYEFNSWQCQVISSKSYDIIFAMVSSEGTENYEQAKKEYDDFVKKINIGNWRTFVQAELDDVNEQIKTIEAQNDLEGQISKEIQLIEPNIQKQVLEWRLEKDIPYGNTNKNQILSQWEQSKKELANIKEQEKNKPLTYEEKYEKQSVEEMYNLSEYYLKNNLSDNIALTDFNGRWNLTTESDSSLINTFYESSLFIVIVIVVIAGTIVSEEFNKGTVKLLLVRPYKRVKILTAKFIACLIILVLTYLVMVMAQFICGGITNGFGDYIGKAIVFNFSTNSVQEISTIKYMLLSGIAVLPQFLLLMTLAFSLSVLFINSPIAIALPLLGMMGSELINQIAYEFEKAKFLRFFVTPNWDLSKYLFGKLPQFEPISLSFSIIICLIYFVIMLVVSLILFKKREIKNI